MFSYLGDITVWCVAQMIAWRLLMTKTNVSNPSDECRWLLEGLYTPRVPCNFYTVATFYHNIIFFLMICKLSLSLKSHITSRRQTTLTMIELNMSTHYTHCCYLSLLWVVKTRILTCYCWWTYREHRYITYIDPHGPAMGQLWASYASQGGRYTRQYKLFYTLQHNL